MAVYEQTYKRYAGPLTPEWSRFLIIPRHALRSVFNSKLFAAFFALCFLPLLVEAILIYLRHNVGAIAALSINVRELIPDRKSTRLNSSHSQISYAVFCLKKKNRQEPN